MRHTNENMIQAKNTKMSKTTPSICWFEIPADNPDRARKFYGSLFGWRIEKFPGVTDYWHIDTGSGSRRWAQPPLAPAQTIASVNSTWAPAALLL